MKIVRIDVFLGIQKYVRFTRHGNRFPEDKIYEFCSLHRLDSLAALCESLADEGHGKIGIYGDGWSFRKRGL